MRVNYKEADDRILVKLHSEAIKTNKLVGRSSVIDVYDRLKSLVPESYYVFVNKVDEKLYDSIIRHDRILGNEIINKTAYVSEIMAGRASGKISVIIKIRKLIQYPDELVPYELVSLCNVYNGTVRLKNMVEDW